MAAPTNAKYPLLLLLFFNVFVIYFRFNWKGSEINKPSGTSLHIINVEERASNATFLGCRSYREGAYWRGVL